MKTPLWNCQTAANVSDTRGTLGTLLLGTVLLSVPFVADAQDSFQMTALLNPSQVQMQTESRGRVMIYDGLEDDVVERALDTQFGRIENMMFVRIRKTQPDGEILVEDDGC